MCEMDEDSEDELSSTLRKSRLKLGKTIGEGSYCKVKVAVQTQPKGTQMRLACKIIDKRRASKDYVEKFLPRELSIIRGLRHPHVVETFEVVELRHRVLVLMELCLRGDLLEHIRSKGRLHEKRANCFFRQLVDAVDYLHHQDIGHRDLKCENVLLASRNVVKIADFGFARRCRDIDGQKLLSDTYCGSAAYAAPEILQGVAYDPALYDVWSLGCVLFVMLTAAMPYDDSHVSRLLRAQLKQPLVFPASVAKRVSIHAQKLVRLMLEPDVNRRITVPQIRRHRWLKDSTEIVDWSAQRQLRI